MGYVAHSTGRNTRTLNASGAIEAGAPSPAALMAQPHLLVRDMAMGRSLAHTLGSRSVALMRGHGSVIAATSVPSVVYIGVYLQENARLALLSEIAAPGQVHYLSEAEAATTGRNQLQPKANERAWEAWCAQVGMSEDD